MLSINISQEYEDVKQRYKVMRGFKSFESANAFLAMKAGISLELGQNRLLHLIKF